MLFAITAIDKPDGASVRAATRAAHIDYVRKTGVVKLAGPFLGPDDVMIGSLLILDVEDMSAAKAWAANDPYTQAGLFAQCDIRPWKVSVNACGAAL